MLAGLVQVWFTFGSGLVQVWLLGFRLVSDSAFRVQGGFRLGFRFFVYSMLVSLLQSTVQFGFRAFLCCATLFFIP